MSTIFQLFQQEFAPKISLCILSILRYKQNPMEPYQSQENSGRNQSSRSSDSEDSRYQIKTDYPYTRYQLAQQMRIPPENHEDVFNSEQCQEFIKDYLDDMEEFGYHFNYTSNKDFAIKKRRPYQRARKVKLRLYCEGCDKSWTSIVGTIQVTFQMEQVKDETLVNFRIYIYSMQCKICNQMSEAMVYESQLNTFAKIFCLMIAEILEDVTHKKYKDNRYKMYEVHHHIEQLCEACQKGKCFAVPKPIQPLAISKPKQSVAVTKPK